MQPLDPTFSDLMSALFARRDPRAIAHWRSQGRDIAYYWGVSQATLHRLARQTRAGCGSARRHDLALMLWDTGIHDARLLATLIAEPRRVTPEMLDDWLRDADTPELADAVCAALVLGTPYAVIKMRSWRRERDEVARRAGWMLFSAIASNPRVADPAPDLSEEEMAGALDVIEEEVLEQSPAVREGMTYALIAVGSRCPSLNARAVGVARRVGRIAPDRTCRGVRVDPPPPNVLSHLLAVKAFARW